MTRKGQYLKWTEKELQMTVASYRNGDCDLNECSGVYGVPKATIMRHAMKKNCYINGVKSLGGQGSFFRVVEEILADHITMLEECFGGAVAEH
jgi:hypothetical protein